MKAIFVLTAMILTVSTQTAIAQLVCQRAPQVLDIEGSIADGDNQQLGRLTRDGRPSTCAGEGGSLENSVAVRRDTHNFANPYNETVCVRVEMDFTGCAGNQTQSVAYSNFNPLNPGSGIIGDAGFSTIGTGSYSFSVGPNAGFTVGVNEVAAGTGCPLYRLRVTYLRNCRQPGFDRTNDGRADIAIYRPSGVSKWWTADSETNEVNVREFGTVGDLVTGGSDYTGDGQSDLSVYRPGNNTWYYGTNQDTPGSNFESRQWGIASDRVLPGDFDGDGVNDISIFRPSTGTFYVLRSTDGALQARQWGLSTDIPVTGDFDGDTITDFAIVRPNAGGSQWWILKSNYNHGFSQVVQWGLPTDKLVPADYDGDTITDLAIWRPSEGNFYVRRSSDLTMEVFRFGSNGDIPQPADYDGDGEADFALWRPSNGVWYINNSGTNTNKIIQFGQQGDQPISAPYRIQ